MQPPAPHGASRGVRVLVVTRHHRRALEHDLARGARGDVTVLLVHDAHAVHLRQQRFADGAGASPDRVDEVHDVQHPFGQSVGVDDGDAEPCLERVEQRPRNRCHAQSDVVVPVLGRRRLLEQDRDHRRHHAEEGDVVSPNARPEAAGAEALGEYQTCPREGGRQQRAALSVQVGEREHAEEDVVTRERGPLGERGRVEQISAMREDRTFRRAGRPRRIKDAGRVAWGDVGPHVGPRGRPHEVVERRDAGAAAASDHHDVT